MAIITGRIYDILKVSDKLWYVVLRKRDRGKYELSALTVFGWWKDKAEQLGIKPKDKIKANYRIRSKEYNGKYYTEAVCREIMIIEQAPFKVDIQTGELF